MEILLSPILALSILAGQLIKLPFNSPTGVTLLDLVVIFLILLMLIKKPSLKNIPLFYKFSLAFVIVGLISLILSPLKLSINQSLISLLYNVRLTIYLFFGFLIYQNALPKIKKDVEKILLFSATALSILGILQLIFIPDLSFLAKYGWDPHYFRVVSTFLDPNFCGGFLALTLLLITQSTKVNFKKKVTLFLIIYLALAFTFSRSSLLLLLVGLSTLAFLKKSLKLLALMVISGLIFWGIFAFYQKAVAEPRNINRTQSAEYRLNTWQQGLTIFQKDPLLGVGFNSYHFALSQYQLADTQALMSHGSTTNDSSLLYVAATTGVIGLIVYLAFLGDILLTAFKKFKIGNDYGALTIAATFGLLANSFFVNSLFYSFELIWLLLIVAKLSDKD